MHDGGLLERVDLCAKLEVWGPTVLGVAAETAVFRHLFARYYTQSERFTYSGPAGRTERSMWLRRRMARLSRYRRQCQTQLLSLWERQGEGDQTVTLLSKRLIAFELKYRAQHAGARELRRRIDLCERKKITRGYVVAKSLDDFGVMTSLPQKGEPPAQIMRIPAPLLCYGTGDSELDRAFQDQD